jgi:murein DD-endopeptidase MepM/ murein hydrolase activator NlpD
MTTKIDYINPITGSSNLKDRMSDDFGLRNIPSKPWASTFHKGIDYSAKIGTNILAAADGIVIKTGTAGGMGKIVVIKHTNGESTLYAHLSDNSLLEVGNSVRIGQQIGISGNTGPKGTDQHLHFEVFTQDATKLIESNKSKTSLGITPDQQYRIDPLKADSSNENTIQPKINSENPLLNLINYNKDNEANQGSVDEGNQNPTNESN